MCPPAVVALGYAYRRSAGFITGCSPTARRSLTAVSTEDSMPESPVKASLEIELHTMTDMMPRRSTLSRKRKAGIGEVIRSSSFGNGPTRNRTENLLIKSQLLCQLSYRP